MQFGPQPHRTEIAQRHTITPCQPAIPEHDAQGIAAFAKLRGDIERNVVYCLLVVGPRRIDYVIPDLLSVQKCDELAQSGDVEVC